MKSRIKKIRKELDLTQQKFADKLGVKRNTVAQWETGINSLTGQVITAICREFSVNEEWLRNGTGDMFIKTSDDALEQLRQEYNLDDFTYGLIREYLKLDIQKRDIIRDYFYNALANSKKESVPAAEKTVEELEGEYKKNVLNSALKKNSTASNITDDTAGAKGGDELHFRHEAG